MEEKLEKLLEDPSFQDAVSKAASAEEVSALLAQHGIQIAPEELHEIITKMESESELSEDELDDVAGGSYRILRMLFYRLGQLCRCLHDYYTRK